MFQAEGTSRAKALGQDRPAVREEQPEGPGWLEQRRREGGREGRERTGQVVPSLEGLIIF